MALEIQALACDRHKNVVGLNQLMGSQPSPLDNWISYYIYTDPNPSLLITGSPTATHI
jgi:hypothetical protein